MRFHCSLRAVFLMRSYAVVLGVITLAVVGVFTALSGGISGAISTVTSRI